jgi:hypothetical protein
LAASVSRVAVWASLPTATTEPGQRDDVGRCAVRGREQAQVGSHSAAEAGRQATRCGVTLDVGLGGSGAVVDRLADDDRPVGAMTRYRPRR